MQELTICRDNINLIMDSTKESSIKDQEFLNALWQYVLYSKDNSRILPECEICSSYGEFTFEGFGGVKKVGNGIMYVPVSNEKVYIIPNMVFHYFYIHNIIPTPEFRDAVVNGEKPDSEQYIEKIKFIYVSKDDPLNVDRKKCSYCGNIFHIRMAYRSKRKTKGVTIFREKFCDKIFQRGKYAILLFQRGKYVGICYKCLHYTKWF